MKSSILHRTVATVLSNEEINQVSGAQAPSTDQCMRYDWTSCDGDGSGCSGDRVRDQD